jgi:predicted phosphodiesterase
MIRSSSPSDTAPEAKAPTSRVIVYGDPHGRWTPLLRACDAHHPSAVIIVGDCDLARPLREELASLWEAGIAVHYIVGNHDTDTVEWWDRLVGDHETGNLHGRVRSIGGFEVAGLGGVFRERIWNPEDDSPPRFRTREQFLGAVAPSQRFRRWLPLKHRSTIFPEDFDRLAQERADVLVVHEAPSTHENGFRAIDDLGAAMRARLIIHGHHHRSYEAMLASGVRVRGLGLAEPWVIDL